MKTSLFTITCALLLACMAQSQTLTLVTNKRLYEHHSSALSNAPYGYANANSLSGYDFFNHTNVASGNAALAASRDMVEHNGYFSFNGTTYGWKFGFTSNTSNIGNFNYQGNNTTKFYLNNAVSFSSLNTVSDLIAAYNPAQATKFDTAVAVGNVYIVNVRNTDMYLAMRITSVINLTAAQVNALDANQQVTASVYFGFEYKYGTLCTANSLSVSSSNSIICAGQQATLSASGASGFSWSTGSIDPSIIVAPSSNTNYTVTGTSGDCVISKVIQQKVSACTGVNELQGSEQVEVYPNPFTDFLELRSAAGTRITISDVFGKIVFQQTAQDDAEYLINTQNYSRGIYVITLVDGQTIRQKKLVKD